MSTAFIRFACAYKVLRRLFYLVYVTHPMISPMAIKIAMRARMSHGYCAALSLSEQITTTLSEMPIVDTFAIKVFHSSVVPP